MASSSLHPERWPLAQRLKTRHLLLLVQLDEQRSVLAAADAIGMTQSAASKLLAEVETALSAVLFTRHARGVEPTESGLVMVRHARKTLAELKQAHAEVMALRSGIAGRVAIGTVITSATNLIPSSIALLQRRHPQIQISVEVDFSESLVERLCEGKLDMVIARIRSLPHIEGIAYEPLVENPHSVFARSDHPLLALKKVELSHLARQSWVLPPPGNVLRDRLEVIFTEHGLSLPTHGVETAALPVITSVLRETNMVSVLADEVVRADCEAGVLKRLPASLPLQLGSAGIVTLRRQPLTPAAGTALGILREVAVIGGKL
jgi:DNA-binding transcriptional LysR family regulator